MPSLIGESKEYQKISDKPINTCYFVEQVDKIDM